MIGLAAGVITGVSVNLAFGGDHPRVICCENITQPVGQLFLNLLLMIVVPLVFSSLVVGVAELAIFASLDASVEDVRLHNRDFSDFRRDWPDAGEYH